MSDTVLLTGITGFLGGHIARELLNSGYTLRGSLRNPGGGRAEATRAGLAAAGADVTRLELVELELTRDAGWAEAAAGARYVIHAASPFVTTMPKDPAELIGPAVGGVERAMQAAKAAGAERVVLTSSSLAVTAGRGRDRPDALGPEDWARPQDGRMNPYAASKTLAERRAWELAAEGGPELAAVLPGFILGPLWDADMGTSGAVIARLLRGELPLAPRLSLHVVDVRDAARLHVAAMEAPEAAGRRLPAAFDAVSLFQLGLALAEAIPERAKKMPRREAPDLLVRLLALFDGDIRANVNELGYRPKIDCSAAAALLGRDPIRARDAAGAMARSLIDRGLV